MQGDIPCGLLSVCDTWCFYPVPRTGGITTLRAIRCFSLFLSSPPHGGHCRYISNSNNIECFYPVPRVGDITKILLQLKESVHVSIQSPVRGTFRQTVRKYFSYAVSIQSPVRGTLFGMKNAVAKGSCYPVPRAGDIETSLSPTKMQFRFYPVPRAGGHLPR